jgi:hypothetical protein
MLHLINMIDVNDLKKQVNKAQGFPHFCLDNFLKLDFAEEVYRDFPSYSDAQKVGREFKAVNEKKKIQITDASLFPPAIKKLNDLLADEQFVSMIREVFDIETLEADPDLAGGGIHQTDSGGRLDVHIDFNFAEDKQLHRRINLLLYFNKDWHESYGGYLDLWDKDVKKRVGYFEPKFNRLCGFETSNISFHGVTPLNCPKGIVRRSFATYYYTKEAPEGWDGTKHSTVFKPRPNEFMRRYILMPSEQLKYNYRLFKQQVKSYLRK